MAGFSAARMNVSRRVQNTFLTFSEEDANGEFGSPSARHTLRRQKSDCTFDRIIEALDREAESVFVSTKGLSAASCCPSVSTGIDSSSEPSGETDEPSNLNYGDSIDGWATDSDEEISTWAQPGASCSATSIADQLCCPGVSEDAKSAAMAGRGLGGAVTTVMVRHVPRRYSQKMLLSELEEQGFAGRYDFFYLPAEPRGSVSKGFAFVNFDSPKTAEEFYRAFHGKFLRHFPCQTPLVVLPADVQGFHQNAEANLTDRAVRRRDGDRTWAPLFLKQLPVHLTNQLVLPEEPAVRPALGAITSGVIGGALGPSPARAMFCTQCGQAAKLSHRFCMYCGVDHRLP